MIMRNYIALSPALTASETCVRNSELSDYHFENVSLWTVRFTKVILVVLPENLPCCYRAGEGSISTVYKSNNNNN